jgi:hypothetical protein
MPAGGGGLPSAGICKREAPRVIRPSQFAADESRLPSPPAGRVNAAPDANGTGDRGEYVITFAASFERIPLAVPFLHELDHFTAFRSTVIERGRAVFRLHVGYFASADSARAALGVVRRHYTDAHVAKAPRRDLGSLDDTGITEFTLAPPVAAHAPVATTRRAAVVRSPPPSAVALCDTALQRYAIQLGAVVPADGRTSTPELGATRSYLLYRVHVMLDGVVHQAARVGFFPSVEAARQVLATLRARFPQANLVPVSDREYARVRDLVSRQADAAGLEQGAETSATAQAGEAGPATRAGHAADAAVADYLAADADVSCEFAAHELLIAVRVLPSQARG